MQNNYFYKKVLDQDAYGQPLKWILPGGKPLQKSMPGAICSIFVYAILINYMISHFITLINRSDYSITRENQNDFFKEDFIVSTDARFNVAAAITGYGDPTEIEDPSIGTVEFYIKSWLADGSPLKFHKLKTRPCKMEEFSFHDDKVKRDTPFYPVHEKSESLKSYIPKMKCIDEDYSLYGDFSTNVASNLMIVFEKCDPTERTCADESVINEWMEFKYIILAENEENYLQSRPHGERHDNFARISWNALTAGSRHEAVKQVTFHDILLTRSPFGISFDGPNAYTERVLMLEQATSRVIPYKNKIHNSITYEVNHKRVMVQRTDYTLFQLLGGLGGLYSVFFKIYGPHLIALFIAGKPTISIAKQLTNLETPRTGKKQPASEQERHEANKKLSCLNLKMNWKCCVTRWLCCCCCKETRFDKRVKQGSQLVNQQLDITNLLKRLHVLESAFKDTMSPTQWRAKWAAYENITLTEQQQDEQDEEDDQERKDHQKQDSFSSNRALVAEDVEMVPSATFNAVDDRSVQQNQHGKISKASETGAAGDDPEKNYKSKLQSADLPDVVLSVNEDDCDGKSSTKVTAGLLALDQQLQSSQNNCQSGSKPVGAHLPDKQNDPETER